MRISKNWLHEYITIKDLRDEEIEEMLSLSGTEIDSVSYPWKGLEGIVPGRVIETTPHPSSATLKICVVDTPQGKKTLITADNQVQKADAVIVALPGTKLSTGKTIEEQSFFGVVSEGMLCSLEELGLESKSEHVYKRIDADSLSNSLFKHLQLDDTVFDAEVTANRPDELGMLGIATEICAISKGKRTPRLPDTDYAEQICRQDTAFQIVIEHPEDCYRYCGVILREVPYVESPFWLKRALVAGGIRPINLIVDLTNYVMLETGHPIHAFDLDSLSNQKIVVRRAQIGEKMQLLNEQSITMQGFECLITDGSRALALAGIMGAENSGVGEKTRNLLLEVANFNPILIRKTRKLHNLISDASYRFERGVDCNNNLFVIKRLIHLIQKLTHGKCTSPIIDCYPEPLQKKEIRLRKSRVEKILGICLQTQEIEGILRNLGIEIEKSASCVPYAVQDQDTVITCFAPTCRPDLEREIDLIEEIGRIHGYDSIPSSLPLIRTVDKGRTIRQQLRYDFHTYALGIGYNELRPLSFLDPADLDRSKIGQEHSWRKESIALVKPLSRDLSLLRPTLFYHLMKTLAFNFTHQSPYSKVYEIGKVFLSKENQYQEREYFGLAQTGLENGEDYTDKRKVSFFTMKGNVEEIFNHFLNIRELITYGSMKNDNLYRNLFYPTHSAVISFEGEEIGIIGLVRKQVCLNFDLKTEVFLAELNLEKIYDRFQYHRREWKSVQNLNFPSSRKDFSVLVPRGKEMGHVISVLKQMEYIESVKITDIYKGKNIPEGFVSVTVSVILRASENTITESQVNTTMENIRNFFKEENLEIRESL